MSSTPLDLPTRPLGRSGPPVPRVGLGLMSNSCYYGMPASDQIRLHFLDEAYRLGENFWDTADEYGDSEELLGRWFKANPEKRKDIFLATKFGMRAIPGASLQKRIDSSPEYAKEALEKSLNRLGLPYVDLYYVHRLDKVTPIEKTMEALVQLKDAGKIKYIGLSECSAASLRRAHAIHPITAVQMEYSPFCLDIESPDTNLLETARELGVAVVAYSPLGNGILGGQLRTQADFSAEGDLRRHLPMFSEVNLPHNLVVVDKIANVAKVKGVTTGQLTLAWLLAQGDDVFPIPGTTKASRVEENLGSSFITLTPTEEKAVRDASESIVGARFQALSGHSFADTPSMYYV